MKRFFWAKAGLPVLAVAILFLASCSSTPKVSRVDANTQIDLSGYWNDNDVRIVCESLISECLNAPRVAQAVAQIQKDKGRNPLVIVGTFRNESSEPVDMSIISKVMETTIFNSGVLDFVADSADRDALRSERADQDDWGAGETSGNDTDNEMGADFMLSGSVKTVIDRAGNQSVRAYFVDANLTNIRANTRLWMGQNGEIKKVIARPKAKL